MSVELGAAAVDDLETRADLSHAHIMLFVRVVGSAMIGIAVVALVLTEFFTMDAVDVSGGPFESVMDSLTSTGTAALGLLVIGLLVIAARGVMGFFGGGF